ncbi:unnamed protein product [Caenorhabditis auriculariae]|uniref:Uncharacterized protein n=1 Tax=Caenorhabditis auriculariae TaxID=2777116 RepID=A0A8S1GZS2_9PELO|nr:unnamed protein product [Caenorhabditis auriculariae]
MEREAASPDRSSPLSDSDTLEESNMSTCSENSNTPLTNEQYREAMRKEGEAFVQRVCVAVRREYAEVYDEIVENLKKLENLNDGMDQHMQETNEMMAEIREFNEALLEEVIRVHSAKTMEEVRDGEEKLL